MKDDAGWSLQHHSDSAEICSYLTGEIATGRSDRFQDHLCGCASCCDLLLAAADYLIAPGGDPDPPFAALHRRDREADWQALCTALGWRAAPRTGAARPRHHRLLGGLAACLALLCLGLLLRIAVLESRLDGTTRPTLQVTALDLVPDGALRGGNGARTEVSLPPAIDRVLLILHLTAGDAAACAHCGLVLIDEMTRRRLTFPAIVPDRDANVFVEIARADLPAGPFRLEVEDADHLRHAVFLAVNRSQ